MSKTLDNKLIELQNLNFEREGIDEKISKKRQEIFTEMKKLKKKDYKNDNAVIFPVARKTIKFIRSKEEIINEMEQLDLGYVETVTEKRLTKEFETSFKNGDINYEGIKLETTVIQNIKFNKPNEEKNATN